MQWKVGVVIIHCTFSLCSASGGGQEPSRKRCNFPPWANTQYLDGFARVTQTHRHIHAERQDKLAKSQSSKSTGLAVWVQAWDCHLGLALPLAGPVRSQLRAGVASAGAEQALPKLRVAAAEQTLCDLSAPASQPPASTLVFMLSEENVGLLRCSWCYPFYHKTDLRKRGK